MCRDYPVNVTYEAVPELFAECSHSVVDKDASALLHALKNAQVDPETLEKVRKKLFLG
jgi:DNA-directed RNA polymerase subunit F